MRDFSWQVFAQSGDVDAYLLYKAAENEPVNAELNEMELQQASQLNQMPEDDQ